MIDNSLSRGSLPQDKPPSKFLSLGAAPASRKKITLSKHTTAPRISIKVDKVLKQAYYNLANGGSNAPINNDLLIEYIRQVYEMYDIEDPLSKYRSHGDAGEESLLIEDPRVVSTNSFEFNSTNQIPSHLGQPSPVAGHISARFNPLQSQQRQQQTPKPHPQLSELDTSSINVRAPIHYLSDKKPNHENSSSKTKLRLLKQNFREQSQQPPVECRVIGTPSRKIESILQTSHASSSASKPLRLGYATPQSNRGKTGPNKLNSLSLTKDSLLAEQLGGMKLDGDQHHQPQQVSIFREDTNPKERRHQGQESTQKLHQIVLRKSMSGNKSQLGEESPTIFRYCFLCECPILESNIRSHQSKCPNFKQLYECSLEELVTKLNRKTNRLKSQIEQLLQEQRQQRLRKHDDNSDKFFTKLSNSVSKWMASVSKVEKQGAIEDAEGFEAQFQSVVKCFDTKLMQILEKSHKLRWFLHIRDYVKSRFQV